ncbi:ATP-binding protein [Kitasatospora sp. NPDC091335]|uniref:ATP-binding protein n=1 Tax=Kitasatospora sp. NPDC091335 TaxID=3364085 RepID=UPI0037F2AEDE
MTVVVEPRLHVELEEPLTRFTAKYPYTPEAAALSRWLVDAALASWGMFDLIDPAVLVASELVTNAIQTGCQLKIGFQVERLGESTVRITVSDGSCSMPVFVDAGLPAGPDHVPSRGRGLVIVNSLARRWGVDLYACGKDVWAELRLRPQSRAR